MEVDLARKRIALTMKSGAIDRSQGERCTPSRGRTCGTWSGDGRTARRAAGRERLRRRIAPGPGAQVAVTRDVSAVTTVSSRPRASAREPGPRATRTLFALGPGYFAGAKFRDDRGRSWAESGGRRAYIAGMVSASGKFESWLKPDASGLLCEPGGFHIDPLRAVDRAIITHGHSDHARPGHGAVLATPRPSPS